MNYEEHRPEPSLAGCIHRYWFLSAAPTRPRGRAPLQPIVPDGRMELIVNLADRFLRHHRDGSVERQAPVLIAGQITGSVVVEPGGTIDLVGVRFRPAGVATLLPLPARELRDRIVDSALVATELGRDLADRLHGAADGPARIRVLDRHFARLRTAGTEPDRAVCAAVEAIGHSHGRIRIPALAASLGMTERTLERRFQSGVGVGPKLYARIVRFQQAFRRMQAAGPGSWTSIAHRSGYYDQAHLIREFRTFAGTNPSRFFAGRTTLADFFSTGDAPAGAGSA